MHANAPLTAEGVAASSPESWTGRLQAHVAAESRLTRATVRAGVTRFRAGGTRFRAGRTRRWPTGPAARIAATRLDSAVVARIEALRRDQKHPFRPVVDELAADGVEVSVLNPGAREVRGHCAVRTCRSRTESSALDR